MRAKRSVMTVTLAALVGLSGCGASSPKADPALDRAVAQSSVFQHADLAAYTSSPHTTANDFSAKNKRDFASCMNTPTTNFDAPHGAQVVHSANFSNRETEVSVTIRMDPTRSENDAAWKQVSATRSKPCLQQLFDEAITAGTHGLRSTGNAFASSLPMGSSVLRRFEPQIGARSVGYEIGFPADVAGTLPDGGDEWYLDSVYVSRGRAEMAFDFLAKGVPMSHALESALAQKVYDRIGDKAK